MLDGKRYFRIGEAAKILHIHPQTLRLYDRKGVISPRRIGRQRLYSVQDLFLINCVREMIHQEGFNLNSLSIVLKRVECWEINRSCEKAKREKCLYYRNRIKNQGKKGAGSS